MNYTTTIKWQAPAELTADQTDAINKAILAVLHPSKKPGTIAAIETEAAQ